jgi:hypothetical protein
MRASAVPSTSTLPSSDLHTVLNAIRWPRAFSTTTSASGHIRQHMRVIWCHWRILEWRTAHNGKRRL